MLRLLDNLPDNVLGLEAIGKISADDYRTTLVPAVETLLARHAKARLLYVLGKDFSGFTGGAAWQDARLGMKHFTDFERVAVVTDTDWIEGLVRAFGFFLPGDVETFETGELDEARDWIVQAHSPGQLEFELDKRTGVLILRPSDELEVGDFERVAAAVDAYTGEGGGLSGLMIVTDEFPGWDSFAAMTSHFRFVREHHDKVRRVALVTSSRFLSALPRLAKLFVDAEVRHFDPPDVDAARTWVSG